MIVLGIGINRGELAGIADRAGIEAHETSGCNCIDIDFFEAGRFSRCAEEEGFRTRFGECSGRLIIERGAAL